MVGWGFGSADGWVGEYAGGVSEWVTWKVERSRSGWYLVCVEDIVEVGFVVGVVGWWSVWWSVSWPTLVPHAHSILWTSAPVFLSAVLPHTRCGTYFTRCLC